MQQSFVAFGIVRIHRGRRVSRDGTRYYCKGSGWRPPGDVRARDLATCQECGRRIGLTHHRRIANHGRAKA